MSKTVEAVQHHKAEEKDNWGSISYELEGVSLRPGQTVEVKFPDGFVRKLRLSAVAISRHVSDHGHTNTVHSTVPAIRTKMHGVLIDIPLNRVKLRLVTKSDSS